MATPTVSPEKRAGNADFSKGHGVMQPTGSCAGAKHLPHTAARSRDHHPSQPCPWPQKPPPRPPQRPRCHVTRDSAKAFSAQKHRKLLSFSLRTNASHILHPPAAAPPPQAGSPQGAGLASGDLGSARCAAPGDARLRPRRDTHLAARLPPGLPVAVSGAAAPASPGRTPPAACRVRAALPEPGSLLPACRWGVGRGSAEEV